ncbi:MAG: glycosyltransferase family 4 protein [Tenuifilaceae bacterium]|nr:glycosyltransferase family 4 protein [Tenuifilaceae bacterium]
MSKTQITRALFLIQLPPPIHGASVMNQSVYHAISTDSQFETRLISLNFARDLADLQKVRLGKVFKAFAILFRLIWQLLTFRPSTVYFSMVPLNFVLIRDALYLLIIKLLLPKGKYVLHFHRSGLIEYSNKWGLNWFYRILFRGCDIVHLSEGLVRKEILPLKLQATRVHVIPNFISNSEPTERNKAERDPNCILFLSNLLPHKGFDKLVQAFALLTDEYPQLRLTIAGQPQNLKVESDLRDMVRTLNLSDRVQIVGFVDREKKRMLLESASILVLPSEREYFPLVILEAMMAGVAVIASERENLSSIFVDKKEILFIDRLTPDSIAESIKLMIENPQMSDEISIGGNRKANQLQHESLNKIKTVLCFIRNEDKQNELD